MAAIKHSFVSSLPDSSDPTLVNPSNWNENHTIDADGIVIGQGGVIDVLGTSNALRYLRSKPNVTTPTYEFVPQVTLISTDYIWSVAPGGTLNVGTNTVTLTPVPLGIQYRSTNDPLYIRISGGVGAAEIVLITGGTAVSGAASGTITFVCANSHSGAFTLSSCCAGIQEALYSLPSSAGGKVVIPAGDHRIYQTIRIAQGVPTWLAGVGKYSSVLRRDSSFLSGDLILSDNLSGAPQRVMLSDFWIISEGQYSLGTGIHLKNTVFTNFVRNVIIWSEWIGVHMDNADQAIMDTVEYSHLTFTLGEAHAAFKVTGDGAGGGPTVKIFRCFAASSSSDANQLRAGLHITGSDGVNVIGCLFKARTGLLIDIASNSPGYDMYFVNCLFDDCGDKAADVKAQAGHLGFGEIYFTNCHFSRNFAAVNLVTLACPATVVGGFGFTSCLFNASLNYCLQLSSAKVTNVSGCTFVNSAGGLALDGTGLENVTVTNNHFMTLTTGLLLNGTINNWVFEGNQFRQNTSNLLNLGTITATEQSSVERNIQTGVAIPSLTPAATVGPFLLDDIVAVSQGATTINTISGGFRGAKKTFYKVDAGTVNFGTSGNILKAATISQNDSLTLVHNGTKWMIK